MIFGAAMGMIADLSGSFGIKAAARGADHDPATGVDVSTTDRRDGSAWCRESTRPITLREVMDWEPQRQSLLLRVLLPVNHLVQFGVDPITLTDPQGRSVIRTVFDPAARSIRLEVRHTGDARDALMEIELCDTPHNQLEALWLTLQDPLAPRFDTDVMPDGVSTMRGTVRRNLAAEAAAQAHGLAPGQVRRGLGDFSRAVEQMETFMLCLGHTSYIVQPLYYHTAVLFERVGFSYLLGQKRMEEIHAGFVPGGPLRARLDGSSPFRTPALADTVRGRSWAIHDGILGERWDRVRMIKRLGVRAGVNTCPGVAW